jgi:NitT/TauT family transport system permease protein
MNVTTSAVENTSLYTDEGVYEQDNASHVTRSMRNQRTVRTLPHTLSILPPLFLALLILIGWYVITASNPAASYVLPTPTDVFSSLLDGIQSGIYWSNGLITIQESMLGFLLALAIALPVGYGVARSRLVAHTLQPYLAAGQAIPAIVIAPFLFLWLGTGVVPVIVVCMLVVLFPMIINTILGVQTIDPALIDAARVEGAVGWSMLANIEFPLALPAILAGIRSGLTLSITGALVGEFVCSPDQGLGALVQIALHQYNLPFMFATVIILAILAALYYSATWVLVKVANAIY